MTFFQYKKERLLVVVTGITFRFVNNFEWKEANQLLKSCRVMLLSLQNITKENAVARKTKNEMIKKSFECQIIAFIQFATNDNRPEKMTPEKSWPNMK